MNKKFLSRRGWLIYFPLALFPFIFSFGFLYISLHNPSDLIPLFWTFILLYIFLLSLLKTNYQLNENQLVLRMSFFRKKILVQDIEKISRNNSFLFIGWKYSLTTKGLILHSNSSQKVLVTPEKEDEFIELLKSINPAIEINI